MEYAHLIVRDPKLCDGEPVIRGTRVTLRTILASLAEGDGFEEILREFPSLTPQDLRAIVGYAAAAAQEELTEPRSPIGDSCVSDDFVPGSRVDVTRDVARASGRNDHVYTRVGEE